MSVTRYLAIGILLVSLGGLWLLSNSLSFAQNGGSRERLFTDAVAPPGVELSEDEKVMRSRFVTLDLDLLFGSRKGGASQEDQELLLNLFDDARYVVQPDSSVNAAPGEVIWRGVIKGQPSSTVTMAVNQDVASGTVRVKNQLYKLHYVGGGVHVIKEMDLTEPWLEEPPIRVTLPESETPAEGQALTDDGSIIDIMVVYTPATRQQFGSTAGMEAEIDLAIEESNQGYVNSQINTQLRLVHTAEVSYSASGNLGTDLSRMREQDDGYMDQVHALRDTYKADLVSLLVENSSDGRCGVGYLMGSLSHNFESWAFNVVRGDCTTGFYVFPHEVGHNMGSEHDPNNVQNPPLHPYSYGYWGPNNSFRTIMAYNCPDGCPQIQYFSNPDVIYNGQATGISTQDNARSINSALLTLANFRVSADTPPPSSGTLEVRVSQSSDDVEERVSDGDMSLGSSDLELGADGGTQQTVGIRFQNVALPQGATIQSAYIEFETDETDSVATSVQIRAEDSDNAAAFTSSNHNLSNRSLTSASVNWTISAWDTSNETHQSPDLSSIVQELVNRGGWTPYNSMVFVISGSGERTAESYDGESSAAPLLHIEYTSSSSTPTVTATTGPSPTATPTVTPGPGGSNTHFAVIGDFGTDDSDEADVANLVDSWSPEFIVTVGDNVYGNLTFDTAVGKYYCDYLADVTPDAGSPHCNGGNSGINKFFPAFGNHDYDDGPIDGPEDHLNYFTLPGSGITSPGNSGSELYYDFVQGSIHFFVIDSETISNAGGGGSQYNIQRNWLQTQLAASTAPWQLVIFHHAAYSSSNHGSHEWMQWPFASWGADAVLSGHDHVYERVNRDGIVYFVNGLGGRSVYGFGTPVEGSQVRYNDAHGAMLVDANANGITFNFVNVSGQLIDTYTIGTPPPTATPTPAPTVPPNGTVNVRVSQSSDDVEERVSDGDMDLNSTDLELGADNGTDQTVGIRFQHVTLPQGATIQSAYIEFETDSTNSQSTSVQIRAEDTDNAAAFSSSDYDLTNRSLTSASVNWTIPAWDTVDETHQSPDLSSIVQELVNRGGWNPYNSMVFVISGSGERTAESYDGEAPAAPLLHIEYTSSSTPTATPTATPSVTPSATATPTATPSITPTPAAPTISDVRTTNVRDVTFTVSWLTDIESTGELHYGTDPNNLNQTAYDERGAATSDDTHYVLVEGLVPNTTYYFDVVSGSTTDDNSGAHYSVTTGPTLALPSSDTVFGEVFKQNGSTFASGSILYITLQDANGSGSSGQAAPLSALVNSNGQWSANLGNARTPDLSSYYSYSASGDRLLLEAEGAADGTGCQTADSANDTPAPSIVLNVSSCTITESIDLQLGWNHISLPLNPTTPYSASDVCDEIESQGGNAIEIDRWHAGGWQGHICGQTFNNFDLVLGSDYFIKSNANSTWSIEGQLVTTPIDLTLQIGWNSIGIPHSEAYSAESLCDEIISQGVTAVEIDRWHNGGWEGHICGLTFNDFAIERGVGYFVKASSAGTITPALP